MDRRIFMGAALAAVPFAHQVGATQRGQDTLYTQDWFTNSFLNLSEDLKKAAEDQKGLIVLIEKPDCVYCRDLHQTSFQDPEILSYIEESFYTVQLNMLGVREVIDFDGVALEERALANKWLVNFPPTTVLFSSDAADSKSRAAAEAFRVPGLLKPFHYLCALQFVAEGAYRDQQFQAFVQAKLERARAEGREPDLW